MRCEPGVVADHIDECSGNVTRLRAAQAGYAGELLVTAYSFVAVTPAAMQYRCILSPAIRIVVFTSSPLPSCQP
jgi:hypothetical protein